MATLVPELRRPSKHALALSYHTATFPGAEMPKLESGVVALQVQPQVIAAKLGAQGRGFEPRSGRLRLRSEKPALNIGRLRCAYSYSEEEMHH